MDEIYNIRESDCDMEKAEKLFGYMSLEELEKECEKIKEKMKESSNS